jgi:small subunit ribosomal protein S9
MTAAHFLGTGRRKESVARVRLIPGEGTIVVNGKSVQDYFHRGDATELVGAPFTATSTSRRFNAMIKVTGGGLGGQLDAIRHGIARALLQASGEHRVPLRKAGLLTRDPRAKERKKYGLKRARKAPQYTKR